VFPASFQFVFLHLGFFVIAEVFVTAEHMTCKQVVRGFFPFFFLSRWFSRQCFTTGFHSTFHFRLTDSSVCSSRSTVFVSRGSGVVRWVVYLSCVHIAGIGVLVFHGICCVFHCGLLVVVVVRSLVEGVCFGSALSFSFLFYCTELLLGAGEIIGGRNLSRGW